MQIPDGCRLAYTIAHKAWYSDVIDLPQLNVTASVVDGGGCAWEFIVEERDHGRTPNPIRLSVFDETFQAFEQIPEFFVALGSQKPRTLDQVVAILDSIGAVDETEYVQPVRR